MKKHLPTLLITLVCLLILQSQFVELAYKLGFAELKMVAVLENKDKIKVKCDAYALGIFTDIDVENEFQQCINDYQTQGYVLISRTEN